MDFCHSYVAANAPAPATGACERSRPLVVVAGEGKTGTMSLTIALAMLGFRTAHYNCVKQCAGGGMCNASGVSESAPLGAAYRRLRRELETEVLGRGKLDGWDACQFARWDAIADAPVNQLMPSIYQAHGPGTRVILTLRNASSWLAARAHWNGADVHPLGWAFPAVPMQASAAAGAASAASAAAAAAADGSQGRRMGSSRSGKHAHEPKRGSSTSVTEVVRRSADGGRWAYLAASALAMCLVRPEDLLVLNILEEPAARLWQRLSAFLRTPLAGIDTATFPAVRVTRGGTPFCRG